MRVVQRLQQAHTLWAFVALFGALLLAGCLPGERANDPLPDVTTDAPKADAPKTDAKGDGATTDGSSDAAVDVTSTDEDVSTIADGVVLGCKSDADCAGLVTLPCQATPTCNATSGLCESKQLDVDTPCVSDLCLIGQKCDASGTCAGGTPKNCGDGNACTIDLCGSGVCSHPFADLICSDGDACTISDHCVQGVCKGTKLDCNDFNPCTKDVCNPNGDASASVKDLCNSQGFPYNPADPTPCTGNAAGDLPFCHQGSCGVPMDCDDKNPCTDDSPNPVTGKCDHTFLGSVACGSDKCSTGTCTQDDKGLISCVTKPKCTTTKVCMIETCDPGTGTCSSPTPQPKGTACGDECTANGTCDGASKPKCNGTAVVCNDGNPCTVDACDPINGVTHKPVVDGTDCGNNSACSQGICKAK